MKNLPTEFKRIIKRELSGWKAWQIIWIIVANAVIIGVSIYNGDSLISIFAAVTGVICVILCGLGKVSNYFFGTINVILYAIVAYKAKYYGDVMLNLLYYFPTNIIGWILWEKNLGKEKVSVTKKRMTVKQDILVAFLSICAVGVYSLVLWLLDGNLPVVDSMSTVFSVIAQILSIKRFTEQWVIWIIVNVVSVIMWITALFNEGASIAMLLMWSVYLGNSIIMFVKWMKESRKGELSDGAQEKI